jgi:hypothetical protein
MEFMTRRGAGITQPPSARRAEAWSMPESRASGRSEATRIDRAEHGGTISCVMTRQSHAPPHTTLRGPIANCGRFVSFA